MALVAAVVIQLAWVTVYVARYGDQRDERPADAIVVLGAAQWYGRPSPVFAARLDHAIDLYQRGVAPFLVFTGGRSPGAKAAEAEAGRRYALAKGVPAAATALETVSRTTWDNLVEARRILRDRGAGRVLLVSDPLHMARAVAMARTLGLDAHPSATPSTRFTGLSSRARFLAREVYFYNAFLVRRLFD